MTPDPASPYARLGGAPVLRAITDHFYDLMDHDPRFAQLRAIHAPDLTPMREALPAFLSGWSGGPRHWWDANPGKCMVSMHAGFAITPAVAEQWAVAMREAINHAAPADAEIAHALSDLLAKMAVSMGR